MNKPNITNTKKVHIAWTNTDCTEGRGAQVPLYICESRAQAIRMGRKGSVQGCDCVVTEVDSFLIDGHWYAPARIMQPLREDEAADKVYEARTAAIKKAKAAGLTGEEINALLAQ